MARRLRVRVWSARVADVSAATRVVVVESGSITFCRGRESFTLDASEAERLLAVLVPEVEEESRAALAAGKDGGTMSGHERGKK